jgi:putative transposase
MPVAVTCRVLKLARQPYYRWLGAPVTASDLVAAHRADALFDAHRDDPEFGYRLLVDEAAAGGQPMAERTAWAICSANGWWSAFGKPRRGKGGRPGPPVHDDQVNRVFTADAPNALWLTDITEHRTAEGKLYLCAVKDVHSNRIVGYSIDSRMKSRLAVAAIDNAVARRAADRAEVAGCIVHSDRGSQGEFNRSSQHLVITEVCDGETSAAGGSGIKAGDAFAGSADAGPACGAGVLAPDRPRQAHRGRRVGGGRVLAGRVALVSPRWRDAAAEPGRAHRPLPVLP